MRLSLFWYPLAGAGTEWTDKANRIQLFNYVDESNKRYKKATATYHPPRPPMNPNENPFAIAPARSPIAHARYVTSTLGKPAMGVLPPVPAPPTTPEEREEAAAEAVLVCFPSGGGAVRCALAEISVIGQYTVKMELLCRLCAEQSNGVCRHVPCFKWGVEGGSELELELDEGASRCVKPFAQTAVVGGNH